MYLYTCWQLLAKMLKSKYYYLSASVNCWSQYATAFQDFFNFMVSKSSLLVASFEEWKMRTSSEWYLVASIS